MLKVGVDRGGDYLDYLVPFVLQTLADQKPDPVTAAIVSGYIRADFGLEIPERALQIVIRRISRKYPLKLMDHVYRIQGEIPNPGITTKRADAARHIHAVVSGLIEFSKSTAKPLQTEDEAIEAICGFLTEFNIPCLRAYLRGTAIPDLANKRNSDTVLVSQYVVDLQGSNPERFESFLIMLQGHMLANALLCPDLDRAPKTYKGVTFYLDTPLLVRILGVEGGPRKDATANLIRLLLHLGAKIASFSHSRDELIQVLRGAAEHINSPIGRGAIVVEARQSGISKSDLVLLAGKVDEELTHARIEVVETPPYIEKLQIDQQAFEKVLDGEVTYSNPRAKQYDVNSVRSVYVLRGNIAPSTVEKSRATLVTSNSGFARAAYEYGQNFEQSRDVSSVITDFSLANMAWLKAPMGSPALPKVEVLAFSYAALHPSRELLDKYLTEIEKLEKGGKITERDHQLLRSSTLAQEELMKLTLGDDSALTEETIIETLERVSAEIKREESKRIKAEVQAHQDTQQELVAETAKKTRLQERLYWKCFQSAQRFTQFAGGLIVTLLALGLLAGLGVRATNWWLGWILMIASGTTLVFSLANFATGTTVKKIQSWIHEYILNRLLTSESKATGISLLNLA
jgi:hypothetical protein